MLGKKFISTLFAIILIAGSFMSTKAVFASGEDATLITVNKTYQGMLQNSYDEKYYSFSLSSDGNVVLSMLRNKNCSWEAEIVDANGHTYKSFDTSYGTTATGYEERQVGLPKGTYFVRISDSHNSSTVTYNFQVKFTAGSGYEKESNDTSDTANLINVNSLYQGTLQDSYDNDYYIFSTPSDGNVTLSMLRNTKSSWNVTLYSLDESHEYKSFSTAYGTAVTGWEEKQIGLPKGTYLIRIEDNNYTENQSYQFQVKFTSGSYYEKEENDSSSTANLMTLNKVYNGALQSSYDKDYYAFTLPADGNVTLSMQKSTKSSWDITLYSTNDHEYKTFSTFKGPTASGLEERQIGLPKGTYIVEVEEGSSAADTPYALQAKYTADSYYEKEDNDSLETAGLINLNAVYKGNINSSYDMDYYSFTITKTQNVRISIPKKQGSSWSVGLDNADGDYINSFNTAYGTSVTGNEERTYTLAPGTYYLDIEDNSNSVDVPYQFGVYTASSQLASSQVTATNNTGKADTVTVHGLGTNDVIKVYNASKGGTLLGTAKAGTTGSVSISISQIGQKAGTLYVSVTKPGWTESLRTPVTFNGEQSKPLTVTQVVTENNKGKPDLMWVNSLGTGDVVKVYNSLGKLIGVSMPAEKGQTAIAFMQLGTTAGKVYVTVTRAGMTESVKTAISYKAE
jgi:hypothetical protein